MSKKARRNYIKATSQLVNRKKMYKAKKQWVVAGMSFLVAMGIGVSIDTGVHASVAPNGNVHTTVQSNSSNIQGQASQLHNKIMANNAIHNTPKSAESNVAKQSPVTSNGVSESASNANSASNKAESVAPSSVSSNVSASSSVAKPLMKVTSVGSSSVSSSTSNKVSNVASKVSNSTEIKPVASSNASSSVVKPAQSFSASNQIKSVSSVAPSAKTKSIISNSANPITSASAKGSVSSMNSSSINSNSNQVSNNVNKGLSTTRPLIKTASNIKTGSDSGLNYVYNTGNQTIEFSGNLNSENRNDLAGWDSDDNQNFENIKHVTFNNITNSESDLSSLFTDDKNIQSINFGDLDTSNVTNMSDMFDSDSDLQSVTFGPKFSTAKINNVSNMNDMFFDAGLQSITIESPNTRFLKPASSDLTCLPKMYKRINNKKLTDEVNSDGKPYTNTTPNDFSQGNVGTFYTANFMPMHRGLYYKYDKDTQTLELTGGTADSDLSYFFTTADAPSDNPENNPNADRRDGLTAEKGIVKTVKFDSDVNLSHVTNMSHMFDGTSDSDLLSNVQSIDLGNNFDTSNVTNMSGMFTGDYNLQSINLPNNFDTSKVTNMRDMFGGNYSLKSLDLGNNFDTSNVTNMSGMFGSDTGLQSLNLGNHFNTSNVTNMADMFNGDSSLKSLNFGNKFNTSNVTNMTRMFQDADSLTSLTLNFDTSNVTNMSQMLYSNSLQSITFGPKFSTAKVTNMWLMFENSNNSDIITNNVNKLGSDSPIKSITIESPNTRFMGIYADGNYDNNADVPNLYLVTNSKDSSGRPYTSDTINDFNQGNVGTFIRPKYIIS